MWPRSQGQPGKESSLVLQAWDTARTVTTVTQSPPPGQEKEAEEQQE